MVTNMHSENPITVDDEIAAVCLLLDEMRSQKRRTPKFERHIAAMAIVLGRLLEIKGRDNQ